jgi:hypothetical protein
MPITHKAKRSKEVKKKDAPLLAIHENSPEYRSKLHIGHDRICDCGQTNINCLSAKEWLKSQIGIWRSPSLSLRVGLLRGSLRSRASHHTSCALRIPNALTI